jgi:LysM repeat protein
MMRILCLILTGLFVCAVPARAQNQSLAAAVASMQQEMLLLRERSQQLSLRVEELEAQNAELRKAVAGTGQSYATVTQLNTAVADFNTAIRAAQQQTKSEVLSQVGGQMEKLANQTNAALDAAARQSRPTPVAAPPAAAPQTFSDNFPKEGVNHTVQPGETVSQIAKKHGAKLADVLNANKIADATRVQVGQVLFIPLAAGAAAPVVPVP